MEKNVIEAKILKLEEDYDFFNEMAKMFSSSLKKEQRDEAGKQKVQKMLIFYKTKTICIKQMLNFLKRENEEEYEEDAGFGDVFNAEVGWPEESECYDEDHN